MYQIFKRLKGSPDCSILIMRFHNLKTYYVSTQGDVHFMSTCMAQIAVFGPIIIHINSFIFCVSVRIS